MDQENKTQEIANQTEIPVSEINKITKKSGSKKFLLGIALGIIVVLLVAIVTISSYESRRQQADITKRALFQSSSFTSKGEYDKAREVLNYGLLRSKDNAQLLAAQITNFALKGNQTGTESIAFKDAKPYIDEALKTNGNNFDVLIAVGYAYETAGQYEEALGYYDRAVKINLKSSDAWFHHGHVLQFLGKNEEANQSYNKSFELKPINPLALIVKGNALVQEGKLRDATTMFTNASNSSLATNQIKSEALTSVSINERRQGKYKEALDWSQKAIAADSTFSPALATYGYSLALTGSNNKGIVYLKKAIEINPRISSSYNQLALAYRADGNFSDAINYHKLAISYVTGDNTIMSKTQKDLAKGMYDYELAKTYAVSGLSVNVNQLLFDAIKHNPNAKAILEKDYNETGLFKGLLNTQDFAALVNP